jgi:hypothetical protein
MQNLNFVSVSNPQDRFGVDLTGKLEVEFSISCVEIVPQREPFRRAAVKNVISETLFLGVGVFPLKFEI